MSCFLFKSDLGGCSIAYFETHNKQLCFEQSAINFEYEITSVAVSKSKIFVLFTKTGCSFDKMPRNNIVAYDFNGQYLYDIGSIIHENWPFSKIAIYSGSTVTQEPLTEMTPFMDDHEYLVCYTCGDLRYILDITDGKVAQKISARF